MIRRGGVPGAARLLPRGAHRGAETGGSEIWQYVFCFFLSFSLVGVKRNLSLLYFFLGVSNK